MHMRDHAGRYGEDFVEKRREKLQLWSNRIARHPVMSRSDVFIHFIHCDDNGVSSTLTCELTGYNRLCQRLKDPFSALQISAVCNDWLVRYTS